MVQTSVGADISWPHTLRLNGNLTILILLSELNTGIQNEFNDSSIYYDDVVTYSDIKTS